MRFYLINVLFNSLYLYLLTMELIKHGIKNLIKHGIKNLFLRSRIFLKMFVLYILVFLFTVLSYLWYI